MTWVVFSYSLPSKAPSSPRVALWRRLRRLGAISPRGGVHILPARDECVEACQWLAREVQQAEGEALMMHVERFEGLSEAQLVELFRQARAEAYAAVDAQAAVLEERATRQSSPAERSRLRDGVTKLRRRHADISRVDFFDAPEGALVLARLGRIEQALAPGDGPEARLPAAPLAAYRDRRWVTRPRPHVDRLACIWLIRRFINPAAVIRYALTPESDEVAFDMHQGEFGHRGNLCTFETMVRTLRLDDPCLRRVGEIVHEIDVRDGRYTHPEIVGLDAILQGWLLAQFSDTDLEAHGVALFEGLYRALGRGQHARGAAVHTPPARRGAAPPPGREPAAEQAPTVPSEAAGRRTHGTR